MLCFSGIRQNQSGATAALIGVTFMVLFAVIAFTVDITRALTARAMASAALRSAAHAAVIMSEEQSVMEAEADNFFDANYPAGRLGATFGDVRVAEITGEKVTFCVDGNMRYALAQAVTNRPDQTISLCEEIYKTLDSLELALVLETSENMQGLAPLSAAPASPMPMARLDALKNAAKELIDILYGNREVLPIAVSLLPYSDAVKYAAGDVNNWLQAPYGELGNFDGCLSNRRNGYDYTDAPPSSPDTQFPRYAGPFEIEDFVEVKVYTYEADLTERVTDIRYAMTPTDTGFLVTMLDPEEEYDADGIPQNLYKGHDLADRFHNELDYLNKSPLPDENEILKSEKLEIATKERAGKRQEYKNLVRNFRIFLMFEGEGEVGQWEVFNNNDQRVGIGTFTGVPDGEPFGISPINTNASYSKVRVTALHNDTEDYAGPQPPWRQDILDSTDFTVYSFDLQPGCRPQQARHFLSGKTAIKASIDALTAGGPTRNHIGLMHGWYALAPGFRTYIEDNTIYPRDYGDNPKIMVFLAHGLNLDPAADDQAFRDTCDAAKQAGIEIYTVVFDPESPAVEDLVRQCATDDAHAFNADDPAGLIAAFRTIADQIAQGLAGG